MRYWLGPWVLDEFGAWNAPDGAVSALDLRPLPVQAQTVDPGVGLFVTPAAVTLSGYDLLGGGPVADVRLSLGARQAWQRAMGGPVPSGARLDALVWDAFTASADVTGESGPRPLMPTRRGVIELRLAGEAVMSTRFDASTSPGKVVLANLRHDYRALRADALEGRLRGPGGVDVDFHRRVLDVWCAKYRLAEDAFIPTDLPQEARLPHATSYTESFNQTASTTIGPDLTWTELQPRWETIGSSSAGELSTQGDSSSFTDSRCRADHDVTSADHYAEITCTSATGGLSFAGWGACARYSGSADTCYQAWMYNNIQNVYVSKIITGTRTNLGNTAQTKSLPDTLKCECDGSTISGYFNGSAVTVVSPDTSITGGTRGGVSAGGGTSGAITYDSFTVADLAAGGTANAYYLHLMRAMGA